MTDNITTFRKPLRSDEFRVKPAKSADIIPMKPDKCADNLELLAAHYWSKTA